MQTWGLALHYQHLLAQLDKHEDAGVHYPLVLDRPVLERQVLAFLIQEEPQLFLGDRESVQGLSGVGGEEHQPHTPFLLRPTSVRLSCRILPTTETATWHR